MNGGKIIRQTNDFRLILRMIKCQAPDDLYHVELENQQIRDKTFKSSYSFFINKDEIHLLSDYLKNEIS